MALTFRDVTYPGNLKTDLEERIASRTTELKALNPSLENFIYSVSHDLKVPLYGTGGYSWFLEESYAGRLDDEGRLFIRNIRTDVRRMNELIGDLLENAIKFSQHIAHPRIESSFESGNR